MAVTGNPGGSGGYGINIPINFDISGLLDSMKQYQAAYSAMRAQIGDPEPGGVPRWGQGGGPQSFARQTNAAWRGRGNFSTEDVGRMRRHPELDAIKFKAHGANTNQLQEVVVAPLIGHFNQQGQTPRAVLNASPMGQPYSPNVAYRHIGAINSALGGWRQVMAGGLPSNLASGALHLASNPNIGAATGRNLVGVSKFFSAMQGIPSWNQITQNQTSNTSYLGKVAGGAWHHATNFFNAVEAANEAKGAIPLAGAVAGAAAVYKGAELASKGLALTHAYLLKSGREAIKTGPGQALNNASSIFDYINNYVPALQQGYKMTAKFDDAVAAVTGKLPDTMFYEPQFHRLATAQMQLESTIKRNFAMTKAGAMGNSSVVDQVRDTFFNAAMQQ